MIYTKYAWKKLLVYTKNAQRSLYKVCVKSYCSEKKEPSLKFRAEILAPDLLSANFFNSFHENKNMEKEKSPCQRSLHIGGH